MSRGRVALAALALALLLLALRAPRGDLAEWKGDEAIEYAKARAVRQGLERPRGIPTTEGPRGPALNIYVLALPLYLRDGPESCRLEVAVFWTLAGLAVFLVGRRTLGGRAALAAAVLLATHPDLVRRGRWAWFPNNVGPVAALTLLAALATVRNPRGRGAGALLALSTLLALLHYSTLGTAALGVGLCAWAAWRGADRRSLAAGLALSAVLATPFVASEAGRGFADMRAALSVAAHGGRVSQHGSPAKGALAYPRAIVAALDLEAFAARLGPSGEAAVRETGPPRLLLRALSAALLLLVAAGALLGARELARRERLGAAGTTLAFVLATWAPFLVLGLPARDHYLQPVLAAVVVLAALALARLPRRAGAALLLLVATTGVLESAAVLSAVARGRSEPGSEYELPLGEKRGAVDLVLEREVELVGFRRFEDLLLLEDELRRLDPERARRFESVPRRESYWELDYTIPRPRTPTGRVELVAAPGEEPLAGEVARSGRIVLRRVP